MAGENKSTAEGRVAELEKENAELKRENKRLASVAQFGEELSEDVEELVQEKMKAGLTRAQAIEVARTQLKHDAALKAASKK